jgi:feruloyl esterase
MGEATSTLFAEINMGRLLCVLALGFAGTPCVLEARPCESLLKSASPTVSIIEAAAVETGTFTPTGTSDALSHLPRFCRVSVQLRPTADSDIGAEIWLPASGWNGKFLAVGYGGSSARMPLGQTA